MFCIEIPKQINNMMSLFYYLGLWHRGDKSTVRETRLKVVYSLYYLLFPISIIAGAIISANQDEKVFLVELAIDGVVLWLKFFYIIWKKDKILEMINHICVFSTENRDEFILANDKIKRFMKFATVLFLITTTGAYAGTLAPLFLKERILIFNIGFPFDWKNNEIAFWWANAFIFTEATLSIIAFFFSIMIWYLMINCALRYEILGSQLKNMGVINTNGASNKRKISDEEKNIFYGRDLITAIEDHQHIMELIHQSELFLSKIFFFQIVTSGLCICGSIYCVALNVGATLVEDIFHLFAMVYHISEIFMITYFGNEIRLSSDRLSYCLFESNWTDKPQKIKKCIIIFVELLQQPHEIVIGKLYPLTLETFRRILNFAYNTFNILKNFK